MLFSKKKKRKEIQNTKNAKNVPIKRFNALLARKISLTVYGLFYEGKYRSC